MNILEEAEVHIKKAKSIFEVIYGEDQNKMLNENCAKISKDIEEKKKWNCMKIHPSPTCQMNPINPTWIYPNWPNFFDLRTSPNRFDPNLDHESPTCPKIVSKFGSNWVQIEFIWFFKYIYRLNPNLNTFWGQPDPIQGLLNRWTVQLDLGSTTGGLERVVSEHNST